MVYAKEQKRAYQRAWVKRRRDDWIQKNGPCQLCGSWEDPEVDHINRSTKEISPARLWSLALSNPTRIAELAKCQVLCGPCHLQKTKEERRTPHGINGYRRGCRCTSCGEAKSVEKARYLARK